MMVGDMVKRRKEETAMVVGLSVFWEPNFRNEEQTTDSSLMCEAEFMGFNFIFLISILLFLLYVYSVNSQVPH